MPGDHIERVVVLCTLEKLATKLVHNLPWFLGNLVMCNRTQKVPRVSQSIRTQWAQLRQLEAGAPDFEDVSTGGPVWQFHPETETALNNNNLAGLDKERTELGLDIESALLRDNQKLAVRVDESLLLHAGVGNVDVCCETFAKRGVARARDGLETGHEVDLSAGGDVKWMPGKLGGRDVDAGVQREEIRLGVFVVG